MIFIIKYWEHVGALAFIGAVTYGMIRLLKKEKEVFYFPNGTDNERYSYINHEVSEMSKLSHLDKNNQQFYSDNSAILEVGVYKIPAHLLYEGKSESRHVINPKLQIGIHNNDFTVNMPYWPDYSDINPNARATYLHWLATGRSAPQANIGLVFLYFYGLEYRAIVDKENHEEIFEELLRLFSIYGSLNASFAGYCSGLICWIANENSEWQKFKFERLALFIKENFIHSYLFKGISGRILASTSAEVLVQSHSLALIPRQTFPHSLSVFKPSISKSLKRKFAERKLDVSQLKIGSTAEYKYKSAGYLGLQVLTKQIKVSSTKKLSEGIEKIYKETIQEYLEFDSYNEDNSTLAVLFRPKEMRTSDELMLKKIAPLLDFEKSKFVEMSEIVGLLSDQKQDTINLATSRKVAQFLKETAKVSIEPDADITSKTYKMQDQVILFTENLESPDQDRWEKSIRILDLAMAFLKSDKLFENKDTQPVIQFIETTFKLEEDECKRLSYRALLLEKSKQSISSAAKKINTSLNSKQKDALARFIFSLATEDGKVSTAEFKALEKMFKALNLEEKLNLLVKENRTEDLIVLKSPGVSQKRGSTIPMKGKNAGQAIALDENALKAAFKEANDVSAVLASVFVEDESETKVVENKSAEATDLSHTDKSILEELKKKERWLIEDIEKMCKSKKIMYGAFFNRINNYYESTVGSEVLSEEDSELCIDLSLISDEVQIA